MTTTRWKWRTSWWPMLSVVVVVFAAALSSVAQDGTLATIRQDVREGMPSQPATASPAPDRPQGNSQSDNSNLTDEDKTNLFFASVWGAGIVASSPIWVPHAMLEDDSFTSPGYFLHFPYDGASGYIKTDPQSVPTKLFAVRLDVEYAETFDRLDKYGGHLLIETAPRLGFEASAYRLEEHLTSGGWDQLQMGDCNFVYRFAQGDWGEFRAGLGLNWLNDSHSTDLGFNFTYAADLYLKKPWILSATIDAGTLGDVGLFRFRTTAGVVFHGVEAYTGYEYTNIGRTYWNGLIGGVRFWF